METNECNKAAPSVDVPRLVLPSFSEEDFIAQAKKWCEDIATLSDEEIVRKLADILAQSYAMRAWIFRAAPMLSTAACIVVDEAVERLGEIEGCRAVLELCPVDFSLENEPRAADREP